MAGIERLAEIDRELDALGKSGDALEAARALARELAPVGLDAIDAALEALAEGRGVEVETRTPAGASARPARWDEPAPARGTPEDGSGLHELPEEVLRSEALPPVLSLPPEAAPQHARAGAETSDEHTDVRDPNSLELELDGDLAAAAAPGSSATRDDRAPATTSDARPLDGLFDDAPVADEGAGTSGLDGLFDTAPPEAPREGEGEAEGEAEGEPAADSTSLFTADEVRAIRSSAPPAAARKKPAADQAALDAALEDALDQPLSDKVEPSEMPPSGEFELMIDEDALVLDADDASSPGEEASAPAAAKKPTMPPPVPGSTAPPAGGSTPPPPGKGFFSRILNRK